mmetsp:Transcript_56480/g.151074  ORF Transcript_56480/g.151074 Transcript_56480/m.151074 type:complete len:213 (-) Transcript_56480:108-746(-)
MLVNHSLLHQSKELSHNTAAKTSLSEHGIARRTYTTKRFSGFTCALMLQSALVSTSHVPTVLRATVNLNLNLNLKEKPLVSEGGSVDLTITDPTSITCLGEVVQHECARSHCRLEPAISMLKHCLASTGLSPPSGAIFLTAIAALLMKVACYPMHAIRQVSHQSGETGTVLCSCTFTARGTVNSGLSRTTWSFERRKSDRALWKAAAVCVEK